MKLLDARTVEESIARCRLVLSVATLLAVYIDPSEPLITHWIPLTTGTLAIDPLVGVILAAYFCFSLYILMLRREISEQPWVSTICIWCDVGFGVIIGVFTEGATGASGVVFLFAVAEAASTAGLRRALLVTMVSALARVAIIIALSQEHVATYIMKPVYMALIGYVIGYIGQQRLNLENGIRALATAMERERVGRDLHDDHVQVLAGIGMRLNTCGELLRRGRHAEAAQDLAKLAEKVYQEYDAFRAYTRTLRGVDTLEAPPESAAPTRFSVHVQFEGSGTMVDHVLQILREGARNVMRHASAATAAIGAEIVHDQVRIHIDDDGVGFPEAAEPPWSIGSRVSESGGAISFGADDRPGAHLAITLPAR